jgi:hypothetical protein
MNEENYITAKQYADNVGISRQAAYLQIKTGKVKSKKFRGKTYIFYKPDNETGKAEKETGSNNSTIHNEHFQLLKKQNDDLRNDIEYLKQELTGANKRIDSILEDKQQQNHIMGTFQKAMGLLESKATDSHHTAASTEFVDVEGAREEGSTTPQPEKSKKKKDKKKDKKKKKKG